MDKRGVTVSIERGENGYVVTALFPGEPYQSKQRQVSVYPYGKENYMLLGVAMALGVDTVPA